MRLAAKAFALDQSEERAAVRSDKALKEFGLRNGISLDWLFLGDVAPTLRYVREYLWRHRGKAPAH